MKKILFLLLLLFSFVSYSQDVRKCRWGMSMDSVKKVETAKPIKVMDNPNSLSYSAAIDGYDFNIVYYFERNRLFKCLMHYTGVHSNAETYYENFLRIADKIDGKYGSHIDGTKWKDDLYKDDEKKYGFAASYGSVTFLYNWETVKASITLILTGDNFKCNMGVVYTDPTHEEKGDTEF